MPYKLVVITDPLSTSLFSHRINELYMLLLPDWSRENVLRCGSSRLLDMLLSRAVILKIALLHVMDLSNRETLSAND